MASPAGGSDALFAGLEAVNAYRAGLDAAVPVPGSGQADAAFLGLLAIAGRALDEVGRLGGDPDGLLRGVYARAMAIA